MYKTPSLGCYINGTNQNQNEADAHLLNLAQSFGMELDREARNFIAQIANDCLSSEYENISADLAQEAEDWLNDQEKRSYLFWYWYQGDFGLYVDLESAKEDLQDTIYNDSFPTEGEFFNNEWLHINDHGNTTLYYRDDKGQDHIIWAIV
jgi:hypothetical protein